MNRPTPTTYKTENWPAYNEALKRRGSLTIRFDPEMSWDAVPTGKRGRRQSYSDACIDPVKICSCYKGEGSDECDDGRQHQTVDGEA